MVDFNYKTILSFFSSCVLSSYYLGEDGRADEQENEEKNGVECGCEFERKVKKCIHYLT